jgi:hypothetical protein
VAEATTGRRIGLTGGPAGMLLGANSVWTQLSNRRSTKTPLIYNEG